METERQELEAKGHVFQQDTKELQKNKLGIDEKARRERREAFEKDNRLSSY